MRLIILSVVSIALAVLSLLPIINFFCVAGFAIGIAGVTIAIRIYHCDNSRKDAKAGVVLGVVGAVANFIAVGFLFVLGNLFNGGFVVF